MRRYRRQSVVHPRTGATLDYMLVIAATLPVVLVCVTMGKRIMQLVWEMLCVQVSWPFL
ncbi:MAG: hypothetical protein Q8K78_15555 [Planctomycetaceae bacterium]|nr:hypothetical protein [Planctomycetaceae bacterium]